MADVTYSSDPAHDPDSRYAPPAGGRKASKKGGQDARAALLRQIEAWFDEARELSAENRVEQFIDCDFYDSEQYTPAEKQELIWRGQAPLVFNLIKPVCDWIIGTERRTRIDSKVLPRGGEDRQSAEIKTQLLKYVSDVNREGWERSLAFEDVVKAGIGWLEEFIRRDEFEEPIAVRREDWKAIFLDPHSRANDLSDARHLTRERWVDLDYAMAMFPEHAEALKSAAVDFDGFDNEEDGEYIPVSLFYNDRIGYEDGYARYLGTTTRVDGRRQRVKLRETWYRKPVITKKIRARIAGYDEFDGQMMADDMTGQDEVRRLMDDGVLSVVDGVTDEMWCAIWCRHCLIDDRKSPYRHNRFPFTPFWGYRRHRDGQPYGIIRPIRDPQSDFNKRRSKALFTASTNRVVYEDDAVDEEKEDEVLEQARLPNGEVRLRPGALAANKFRIDENMQVSSEHMKLMEDARQHAYEGSGVTRENMGQDTNATSGKAILAKQQQGAVQTAALFDNYRLGIQISGEKKLSLIESHMSLPKQIRIIGPDGELEFIGINQPYIDPATGEVMFENDITKGQADFVVDQQDFRETMRLALADQMMEMVGQMQPEVSLQLLDLVIELTDIPKKEEFIARIRRLNGTTPTAPDPEQQAQQAAQQEMERRAQEAELAGKEAKADRDRASAEKSRADAAASRVTGKGKAMDVAAQAAALAPIAPAADRLYEPEQVV